MKIAIFGAGSIGCYVGGRLAAGGSEVVLVGRARIGAALQQHGLTLTDLDGAQLTVAPSAIRFATEPAALAAADLVLVTVKSGATAEAAAQLAPALRPGAVVISFQNGIHNGDELRALLPAQTVVTGMVPFNVVNRGAGRFHQGSEGTLAVAQHPALSPFLPAFVAAGLPLAQHADMRAVQWAKLLLNLNNAVNALSGLPLKAELSQRNFRRCVALAQQEALALLARRQQPLAKLTPLPPAWIPHLLTVPDWLFRLLANRMLAIDPLARSSMWEDLESGRVTEIDWINGEVLRLATELGTTAPVNAKLVALIRAAEAGGRRDFPGAELLHELQLP